MLCGHLITHQCLELDFCLEATLRSMLSLCDSVYVNDGKSTDGTLDLLKAIENEYGKDKLILFEREWIHNRRVWTDQKNFLIDKIPDDAYIFCIDADEVIHEDDFNKIKTAISNGIKAISLNVIHFYAKPTHYISGPVWYKEHTRIWHKSTGIRLYHIEDGCADDVLWPNGQHAHFIDKINCGATIYHYGHCRHPAALGRKARKAEDLYHYSNAYIGGKIAPLQSFSYDFEGVNPPKFTGTHPIFVQEWCAAHMDQPDSWIEGVDTPINKLWCFKECNNE